MAVAVAAMHRTPTRSAPSSRDAARPQRPGWVVTGRSHRVTRWRGQNRGIAFRSRAAQAVQRLAGLLMPIAGSTAGTQSPRSQHPGGASQTHFTTWTGNVLHDHRVRCARRASRVRVTHWQSLELLVVGLTTGRCGAFRKPAHLQSRRAHDYSSLAKARFMSLTNRVQQWHCAATLPVGGRRAPWAAQR